MASDQQADPLVPARPAGVVCTLQICGGGFSAARLSRFCPKGASESDKLAFRIGGIGRFFVLFRDNCDVARFKHLTVSTN